MTCLRCLTPLLLLSLMSPALAADAGVIQVPEAPADDGDGHAWVEGAWGAAPGDFGMVDEASRPGPMDFAVHGGFLYVLDPVNARVQVFDSGGGLSQIIKIGTHTADFMCVDDDGSVVALDAFVKREVRVFSPAGELTTEARLPESLRLPSAIFAEHGQYSIEERHSRVHQLQLEHSLRDQDAREATATRGRPRVADGRTMHARKSGPREVAIECAGGNAEPRTMSVRFPRPLRSVVALESDGQGATYVAAACLSDEPNKRPSTDIVVAKFTSDGELLGVVTTPDQYVTDHYRKLLVTPEGVVVQMQTTEEGVRFIRWSVPEIRTEGGAR